MLRNIVVVGLFAVSACASAGEEQLEKVSGPTVPAAVPGHRWSRLADPAAAGWRVEGLRAAEALWKANSGTSSVMVVHRGLVVAQWGDVAAPRDTRSIRKSLLSALWAEPVLSGKVPLAATVGELGIDDRPSLTESERGARLEDLLGSRSGVYLPAARETSANRRRRPERGSQAPGVSFHYNNWDFNVLGVLYRDKVSADVGGAFEKAVAAPIGMQDFAAEHFEWRPEKVSPHPAYAFRMSARDLARYGLLWARAGRWGDHQVIDRHWIELSTGAVTDTTRTGAGYGWLWWVMPPGRSKIAPEGYFYADGAGFLWVLPQRDLVIVHLNQTNAIVVRSWLKQLPDEDVVWKILAELIAAAPDAADAASAATSPE